MGRFDLKGTDTVSEDPVTRFIKRMAEENAKASEAEALLKYEIIEMIVNGNYDEALKVLRQLRRRKIRRNRKNHGFVSVGEIMREAGRKK